MLGTMLKNIPWLKNILDLRNQIKKIEKIDAESLNQQLQKILINQY